MGNKNKVLLKDICNVITKGTTPSQFSEKGINFIRIENINGLNIDSNFDMFISEKIHNTDLKRSILKKNDILFAIAGATVGKCAIVNEDCLPANTNQALAIIRLKNNYDSFYIANILASEKMKKYIYLNISVGAQPNLSLEQIGNFQFYVDDFATQTKIATFLNLYYKKIEFQKKKIEQLEKLSFDALFTHKYEGKIYKLEQVLTEVNDRTTQNNQYEVISSTKTGLYYQKDYFNKEIASEDNSGYKILKLNQVVISPQNLWLGNINYNDSIEIGIVSPSYKIFNINEGFNKTFISHLLKSKRAMYDYMISSEQGASVVRRNLNIELFNEIIFMIPDIETQNHIAHQLVLINNKINLEKQNLEAMEKYKRGLLQQLFV